MPIKYDRHEQAWIIADPDCAGDFFPSRTAAEKKRLAIARVRAIELDEYDHRR